MEISLMNQFYEEPLQWIALLGFAYLRFIEDQPFKFVFEFKGLEGIDIKPLRPNQPLAQNSILAWRLEGLRSWIRIMGNDPWTQR